MVINTLLIKYPMQCRASPSGGSDILTLLRKIERVLVCRVGQDRLFELDEGGDGDVVIEQAPLLQPITADKAADLMLKRKAPLSAPGARKR